MPHPFHPDPPSTHRRLLRLLSIPSRPFAKGGIIPMGAHRSDAIPAVLSPGQAAPHVRPVPTPVEDVMPSVRERVPDTEAQCYDLTAVVSGRVDILPGTYAVTFSRIARHGTRHSSRTVPQPLTTAVTSTREMTDAITAHVRPYVADGTALNVLTDPQVKGGEILSGDRVIGTFRFASAETPSSPSGGLLYPFNLPPAHDLTGAQAEGYACIYCPDHRSGDRLEGGMRIVGYLRGRRVVAHRDCAEQHRITE